MLRCILTVNKPTSFFSLCYEDVQRGRNVAPLTFNLGNRREKAAEYSLRPLYHRERENQYSFNMRLVEIRN